ncbi:MAG: MauE/DoxX family redox-associated membrane protein [Microthrixaceae bacterium]
MIVAEVMFWAVSLVLIGSGAMKISQPDEFARFVTGASASNGRSSNPLAGSAVLLARITGVVEVGVGALALVNGGVVLGWVLGVMYLLFSGIIAYAIATGRPELWVFRVDVVKTVGRPPSGEPGILHGCPRWSDPERPCRERGDRGRRTLGDCRGGSGCDLCRLAHLCPEWRESDYLDRSVK